MSEFLPYFISEPIYLVKEETSVAETPLEPAPEPDNKVREPEPTYQTEAKAAVPHINYAFFANVGNDQEQILLDKIIQACALPTSSYKIKPLEALSGFTFDKAIIFDNSKNSFYKPETHTKGHIMYARTLSVLSQSIEDKKALWAALKDYLIGSK